MKFANHLSSHITPEWRKQYIKYDELKDILYKEHKIFRASENPVFRLAFLRSFDERFLGFCQEELDKVSSFFNEKEAFYNRVLVALKAELPKFALHSSGSTDFGYQFGTGRTKKDYKKKRDLEMGFSELYLGLVLLQNFQELNYTGFRKILKKHDKLYETDQGLKWFKAKVEVAPFHLDTSVDKQIQEIEDIVTEAFFNKDRGKAMKKLRVPPLSDRRTAKTFSLGVFTGAFLFSLEQVAVSINGSFPSKFYDWETIIRLYRGYFLLNLFVFLMGLNVIGWRRSGVNHVLIFELDPRSHLEGHHLLSISLFLSTVTSLSFVGFLESKHLGIPVYFPPFCLLIFYPLFLINPFDCLWREARLWLLKHIIRIITCPFHTVVFADFWITDQLISITPAFLDFEYSICAFGHNFVHSSATPWWSFTEATSNSSRDYHTYCSSRLSITRTLIRLTPALIRFIQCIRRYFDRGNPMDHLVNAGKYFVTILAVIASTVLAYIQHIYYGDANPPYSNPMFYIWILFSIANTIYAYYWDVLKDWSLFDKKAEVKYLREELVYSSKWYYYLSMGQNLLLRCTWAISLSITENQYVSPDIMLTVTAPLEIWRRFVWNFFRLENEHLNNVGDFRALRDIAITPILKGNTGKKVSKNLDNGESAMTQITQVPRNIGSVSKTETNVEDNASSILEKIGSKDDKTYLKKV